jgi:hypothetical protein
MRTLLAFALLAANVAPALAADPARFTVTGGKVDLSDVVVVAEKVFVGRDEFRSVDVKGPDGSPLAAQIVKVVSPNGSAPQFRYDVAVLLPQLPAGKTLTLTAALSAEGPPAGGFAWGEADGKSQDLTLGGKPVLRYMYAPYEKPADLAKGALTNPTLKVWHHAFDPATGTRLTNGPEGKFPHHRGLYMGFNNVSYGDQKADVWHGRNGESERHEAFVSGTAGPLFGRHVVKVGWHGKDGKPFAHETRQMTVYKMPGGLLYEFQSEVTTPLEKVRLDGDPQHAGFHFRANAAVEANAKQTYFLRPDGKGKEGEEKNWDPKSKKGPVNLPWDAMCFVLDGKRYTALYLDHPANPKEARGSERTYGRVGNYFEYDLTPDKPLRVRYRVWLQPGEMTQEQCEVMSKAFTTPVSVQAGAP